MLQTYQELCNSFDHQDCQECPELVVLACNLDELYSPLCYYTYLIVPSFFRHKPWGSHTMNKNFSSICWSVNPHHILSTQNICVRTLWYDLQMGIGSVTFSLSFKLSIFPISLSDFKKASHFSVNNFCTLTIWSSGKWFKSTFGSHLGLSCKSCFKDITLLSLQWNSYRDKS